MQLSMNEMSNYYDDIGSSHRWVVKIDKIGFGSEFIPAHSVNESFYGISTQSFKAGPANIEVPYGIEQPHLSIEFYDDSILTLLKQVKDWYSEVYAFGRIRMSKGRKISIIKLGKDLEPIDISSYQVIPKNDPKYIGTGGVQPITNLLEFIIVDIIDSTSLLTYAANTMGAERHNGLGGFGLNLSLGFQIAGIDINFDFGSLF